MQNYRKRDFVELLIVLFFLLLLCVTYSMPIIRYPAFGISIFLIVKLILMIKQVNNSVHEQKENPHAEVSYTCKPLMTEVEKRFYYILSEIAGSDYIVQPQVNLASIIKKVSTSPYQTELYRNIDFGVFEREDYKLIMLIELNDTSHNDSKRKNRDMKVKEICSTANIPLITFWLNMPNTREYITSRLYPFLDHKNLICK